MMFGVIANQSCYKRALQSRRYAGPNMIQRERLDGLMEQFSDTNVTLYNDYRNARKLIDRAGGGSSTPPSTPPTPV